MHFNSALFGRGLPELLVRRGPGVKSKRADKKASAFFLPSPPVERG